MFKSFILKLLFFVSATSLHAENSIDGIEHTPLIFSNHELHVNSLQNSVYELLNKAQTSVLIFSFTFSDPEVIRILNRKALEGVKIRLILDRDHLSECRRQLHTSIQIGTREKGEGHLHHKILVVDNAYIWVGSANFTSSSFTHSKNLAIGFYSPEIGARLDQEAYTIASSAIRQDSPLLSEKYNEQLLELYLLPHNASEAPLTIETTLNERGKEKLISLIENAKHHIKISLAVWTYKDASRALIKAKQRGVQIDVVVGQITDEAVRLLIQNGIPVKMGRDLHHKFMLIDDQTLLNGSPNWSMNAFSRSDESFVVLYDLTDKQLKALEGALKVAGLPTATTLFNNTKLSTQPNGNQLINKTLIALNQEMNKTPISQEHHRLISIAKRLHNDLLKFLNTNKTVPVPGCCLYEGDNYLFNVISIAEKQERIESAIKYIKNAQGVDQKVYDYFQNALKKLQLGINVPLPDYFHATRAGLEGIVKSQKILQSVNGLTGPGTYMSCNNEGNHGYGSHTFAIDEGCLVDTKALFRTGRHPQTNVFFSLWASVLKDIPIADNTIAFIDTAIDDVPYVQALLEEQNLHIPIVDRKTSEEILRIFDLTTKRRELPSFYWTKFNPQDYLPQNMYPRSLQGNFRQFTFGV